MLLRLVMDARQPASPAAPLAAAAEGPGAGGLAAALRVLAQGLRAAPAAVRADFRDRLLVTFGELGLAVGGAGGAARGGVAAELSALLPAVAEAAEGAAAGPGGAAALLSTRFSFADAAAAMASASASAAATHIAASAPRGDGAVVKVPTLPGRSCPHGTTALPQGRPPLGHPRVGLPIHPLPIHPPQATPPARPSPTAAAAQPVALHSPVRPGAPARLLCGRRSARWPWRLARGAGGRGAHRGRDARAAAGRGGRQRGRHGGAAQGGWRGGGGGAAARGAARADAAPVQAELGERLRLAGDAVAGPAKLRAALQVSGLGRRGPEAQAACAWEPGAGPPAAGAAPRGAEAVWLWLWV